MELSILFGGPQGTGVQSAAETFAKAAKRAGYWVFSELAYASNIQGKHSYVRIRVADRPVRSSREMCDIVVGFDEETLIGDADLVHFPTHRGHVHQARERFVVFDTALGLAWVTKAKDPLTEIQPILIPVPVAEIIAGVPQAAQLKNPALLRNTVALGSVFALLRVDLEHATSAIIDSFSGKRGGVADLNADVLRAAYRFVRAGQERGGAAYATLPELTMREDPGRVLVKGAQTSALAKLAAGCGLQSYYPIAPATDESTYLERTAKEQNIVVVQCEDEAASACMLVGAAHTGVRASTATSGPGFALMCEAIGVASIMEAPGIVITLYQRSGPSTGMPTRYEQADLLWALHPAQGEFPHILVAPGDAAELFDVTYRAFNWADRYGLPVVVLTDKHQASSHYTLEALPALPEPIDRGALVTAVAEGEHYLRYAGTEGASPRTLPGTPGGIFWTTSDEHDPDGHITEGVRMRDHMMAKRMGKLDQALADIPEDVAVSVYGPADATDVVVFWGSPKGVILDVLEQRAREGRALFRAVQVRLMRPFPTQAFLRASRSAADSRSGTLIAVEENYTGQLQEVISAQTGLTAMASIRKADGRPLKVEELDRALDQVLGRTNAHQTVGVIRVTSDD